MSLNRNLTPIHLDLDDEPYKQVIVHPVVLFSILDQYIRRNESQERVIGTLLGVIQEDGVVQVSNCFIVPHTEKDQVKVVLGYHQTMLALHAAVAPQEQVVGWYTTSFNSESALLHDFYWKEMNRSPVHLLIEPASLEKGNLNISCFYAIPVLIGERGKLQEHFRPLKHVVKSAQGERTALEKMMNDKRQQTDLDQPAPVLSDLDTLESSIKGLIDMITTVTEYVETVTSGKRHGDPKLGRLISDTLSLIPLYDTNQFNRIITKGLQDMLMVVYLANLTKTHLLLAEQLRDQTTQREEYYQQQRARGGDK